LEDVLTSDVFSFFLYSNRKEKFEIIPKEHRLLTKWTNWQSISTLLIELLEAEVNFKLAKPFPLTA
jgi:hypothetical protein